MSRRARDVGLTVLVVVLGGLVLARNRLPEWRLELLDLRPAETFVVTSARDRGPGSLREALFSVAASNRRTSIQIHVPRIRVRSPLPPVVNRRGVDILGNGVVIDAAELGAQSPVIDVASPRTRVVDLTVTAASSAAILVRETGAILRGLTIEDSATGVLAAGDGDDLIVEDSRFEGNRIGIDFGAAPSGVTVRDNEFRSHTLAAVWAVRSEFPTAARPAHVHRNGFESDRNGIVAANVPLVVEANELVRQGEVAVYLSGRGPVVRNNRLREGRGTGVMILRAERVRVTGNEIDRNAGVGVLVNGARGAVVRDNRTYENGYGVVLVFGNDTAPTLVADNEIFGQRYDGVMVIGASPILRDNRLLRNGAAGLRLLDYIPLDGDRVPSTPLLERNRLELNLLDEPVRGEYHEPETQVASQ